MEQILQSLPYLAFFAYFLSNLIFRSFLIQKILPVDLAPSWMNKDITFLLMILNELTFAYWCYSLLVVPNIKTWQAIVGIILLRFFVSWVSKLRALGVYFGYLKNKMKSFPESSDEYKQLQDDIQLISSNPNRFWEECKRQKKWRDGN
jgi:hypothetical protein